MLPPDQITISILDFPTTAHKDQRELFARLELGGQRLFVALRSPGPMPGPVDAIVLLADLFRPGWEVGARLLVTPIIRGDTIYRGFMLERRSSYAPFDYGGWRVSCLIPTPLATEFDWSLTAKALDAFYATIFSGVAHE